MIYSETCQHCNVKLDSTDRVVRAVQQTSVEVEQDPGHVDVPGAIGFFREDHWDPKNGEGWVEMDRGQLGSFRPTNSP